MRNRNYTIIGAGKLGKSLTRLFVDNGYNTKLLARDYLSHTKTIKESNVVFIAVNDNRIQAVCDSLLSCLSPGTIVCHFSGAIESNALLSAKTVGCHIASTHPLHTFPTLQAAYDTFNNHDHRIRIVAEGDDAALESVLPLFEQLGFLTLIIETDNKSAYHAACVFACNYLTTLMNLSLQSAQQANLNADQFWTAIQGMIQTTLSNIKQYGTAKALSGPITRGDTHTLNAHLDALSPTLKTAYQQLAMHTIELAAQRGELTDAKLNEMRCLINDTKNGTKEN